MTEFATKLIVTAFALVVYTCWKFLAKFCRRLSGYTSLRRHKKSPSINPSTTQREPSTTSCILKQGSAVAQVRRGGKCIYSMYHTISVIFPSSFLPKFIKIGGKSKLTETVSSSHGPKMSITLSQLVTVVCICIECAHDNRLLLILIVILDSIYRH